MSFLSRSKSVNEDLSSTDSKEKLAAMRERIRIDQHEKGERETRISHGYAGKFVKSKTQLNAMCFCGRGWKLECQGLLVMRAPETHADIPPTV
jgi:hypothetical protein